MSRRFPVSTAAGVNSIVKDTQRVVVDKGGVSKEVQRALVACGGVLREFWPPLDDPTDPDAQIVWPADLLTTLQVVAAPTPANATIIFHVDTGLYTYTNFPPSAVLEGVFLNPAPGAVGEFVARTTNVDVTNIGDATFFQPDTEGVWFQLDPLTPSYQWNLQLSGGDPGVAIVTADISVAPDTGGGVPDLTKEQVRPCSFYAEVTGGSSQPSDLVWSSVPWFAEELTQEEQADTTFAAFAPFSIAPSQSDGRCIADGDTSGFTQEFYSENPLGDETITVTVFSGTPPTGPAFGTPLLIVGSLVWELAASNLNDDLTCELDVLIDSPSLGQSNTKRVTLHSARTDTIDETVWPPNPEAVFDIGLGTTAQVTIRANTEGFVEAFGLNVGEIAPWPIPWHSDSPNTTNSIEYEVRLDVISGDPVDVSSAPSGVWFPLQFDLEYQWTIVFGLPETQMKQATTTMGFRAAGQPGTETFKPINIQLNTEGFEP